MPLSNFLNAVLLVLVIATLIVLLRVLDQTGRFQEQLAALEDDHARWDQRLERIDAEMDERLSQVVGVGIARVSTSEPKPPGNGITAPIIETGLPAADPELPSTVQSILDEAVEIGYIDAQRWQELESILESVSKQQNKRIWERLFAEIESGNLRLQIQ